MAEDGLAELPFAEIMEGLHFDEGARAAREEPRDAVRDARAAAALSALMEHVKGDRTVGSVVSAGAAPPEVARTVAMAAASLLFAGYEVIFAANEARLRALYDEVRGPGAGGDSK